MAKKTDPNKNLQKYLARIEAAENHRDKNYKELWTRLYKRWRNHVDPIRNSKGKIDPDRSNISIPYTFVQVETIFPRIMETLFAARPYISVKDREPSDLPNAKVNEILLDHQMNEVMDFRQTLGTGIKACCIYGTVVGYTGWKWEEKEVIKKQPVSVTEPDPETGEEMPVVDETTGQPVTELQPMRVNEIEYDDPEVRAIDLGLFYVDPQAEQVDPARYCGHAEYKTREELQELAGQGILSIDWKKVPKDKKTNTAREYRMNSVGLSSDNGENADGGDDGLYEVLHYWEDDLHVVIINRAYVALESENPFWHKKKPYDKAVYIEVPGEFYGMGIPESLEDLQDELNTERNMRIDYRKFLLRRMFKVRKGSSIDKNSHLLNFRQGGIVPVEEMDDVQELVSSDVPGSTFTEESGIKRDMQDASGAQDVVMGASGTGETATTTMSKDNNASMRFRLVISNLEKNLLVPIARKMLQLNQQFIDDERVLRITGDSNDDWQRVAPNEVQGQFDLIAAGSSVEPMANKEAFKQRMVELYTVTANDPIYQQYPDKRRNLLKKVFEAFDIKDTDQVLPTDEEIGVQRQQQLMMQQQQAQQEMEAQQQSQQLKQAEMAMKYNKGGGANTAPMQEQGEQMGGGISG